MGECIIARRGDKSGKYGYTARQYLEAVQSISGAGVGVYNTYYADSYSLNPTTGLFTLINPIHLGTVTDANKYLLAGKFVMPNATSLTYMSLIEVVGSTISDNMLYGCTIKNYSSNLTLVAIRITDSENTYTSGTIVGDEIRRNIT